MKLFDPKRHLPPGRDWETLQSGLIWGHGLSLLSLIAFLTRYFDARGNLYALVQQLDGTMLRQLVPGRIITPFWELMTGTPLWGAWIFMILMGFQAFRHYRYHTEGAMPIYLMRRLPDRRELHRRCLTVPVLASILEIVIFAVGIFLCWLLYRFATPAGCLPM